MEFAYSERTQSPSRLNGMFVGEGVNVGLAVDVSVIVGVNVTVRLTVGLIVGLTVAVSVGVKVTSAVLDGGTVDVGVTVPGVGSGLISVDSNASRARTPIRIGAQYF